MFRGTCARCAAVNVVVTPFSSLCHGVDEKGERTLGTGCYGALEESDRLNLEALATAAACSRADVTPAKLAEFGLDPGEATPAAIQSAGAQAAKAAHDEARVAELPPEKARQIARAVRAEPGKATELLTAAVSAAVDDALAKAAELQP